MCGTFKTRIINDSNGVLSDIMIMSLRYAFGRSDYAVNAICDFIKENLSLINEKNKNIMTEDINAYLKNVNSGYDYNKFTELLSLLNNKEQGE